MDLTITDNQGLQGLESLREIWTRLTNSLSRPRFFDYWELTKSEISFDHR